MCIMCEGLSLDEVRFQIHGNIARHGWALVAVERRAVHPPWAYTIGLCAGFDHPELVVVGLDDPLGARVLDSLAEDVRDGDVFLPGDTIAFGDGPVAEVVPVDPVHFARGVFPRWIDYYRSLGPPLPPPEAVQVWLPEASPLRLDDPRVRLGTRARNRRARRRQRRPQRRRDQTP